MYIYTCTYAHYRHIHRYTHIYLETEALQDLAGNAMAQDKYRGFHMLQGSEPGNGTRCPEFVNTSAPTSDAEVSSEGLGDGVGAAWGKWGEARLPFDK